MKTITAFILLAVMPLSALHAADGPVGKSYLYKYSAGHRRLSSVRKFGMVLRGDGLVLCAHPAE